MGLKPNKTWSQQDPATKLHVAKFGLPDGYWGAISAIIVLASNFGATITASRDRILGTIIAALLGFRFRCWEFFPGITSSQFSQQ